MKLFHCSSGCVSTCEQASGRSSPPPARLRARDVGVRRRDAASAGPRLQVLGRGKCGFSSVFCSPHGAVGRRGRNFSIAVRWNKRTRPTPPPAARSSTCRSWVRACCNSVVARRAEAVADHTPPLMAMLRMLASTDMAFVDACIFFASCVAVALGALRHICRAVAHCRRCDAPLGAAAAYAKRALRARPWGVDKSVDPEVEEQVRQAWGVQSCVRPGGHGRRDRDLKFSSTAQASAPRALGARAADIAALQGPRQCPLLCEGRHPEMQIR